MLFNQAFAELVGFSRAELEEGAATWAVGLTPPEWFEAEKPLLGEAVAKQRPVRYEKEYLRKDGSRVPVEVFAQPVFDETGTLLQYHSFITDISERKRSEAALRESRARLEAALESMTDAVFISDTEGNFIEFNAAFATFHKFADKAECAKTLVEYPAFLDVSLPDGRRAPLDQWAVPRALRGETATNAEYLLRRKDTGETWVGSYSFAPIRDQDGVIVGSVVTARDITEHKRAEEDRQRLLDELQVQGEELHLHNEELAERTHFADSLNAINRLLHATLDFGMVMHHALNEGVEALGAAAGVFELREELQWVVRYQKGLDETVVGLRLTTAEESIGTRLEMRGEPLAIADTHADATVNIRLVRKYGLRSLLAVPLLSRGTVIGCLLFYDKDMRAFSDAEIDFGRKLGATVSLALENARLYEEQQRIAETLQKNFIHELPTVAGLELGVVAMTAFEPELVGGDFSDVFALDDSHVVLLIGDVAGKGVRAAGLTETVRAKMRAFATIDASPAFVLGKTNELLLRFDPDDPHVTAFLAVLDAHTGHLSYASAGHPAPVHLGAFTSRTLEVAFGPPLGTFERPFANAHVMLTLEDYLVLYTDGVTEARRNGELFGEQRLIEMVSSLRGRSAQEVAEGVRDAALGFAGRLRDDLQVVVLRLA